LRQAAGCHRCKPTGDLLLLLPLLLLLLLAMQ
jgi:hypothetical protein